MKHNTARKTIYSLSALLAAVLFLSGVALAAEDLNHETARVTVWIPDGWTQEADDDSLIVTDPAEEIMVAFLVVESGNIEGALDAMEAELSSIVQDVTSEGEPEETEINGMPAIVLDGKGKVEGEAVDLGIAIIMTPAKKALLVFAVAQSSAVSKHEQTITQILGGIKPMN